MTIQDKYKLIKQKGLVKVEDFYDSESYLDLIFESPLNFVESSFENKLNLFCPYFLEYTSLMENPSVAEWSSGFGVFLKLFKRINNNAKLFYVNKEGNSKDLAKYFLEETDCTFLERESEQKFDIIFNDGIFNLIDDETIRQWTSLITNSINKGGVFFLLINLDPSSLRKDFKIEWIHNLIQNGDMKCVWGKHTFSSMWIKN